MTTASTQSAIGTEFTFQLMHEAFGREIISDLNERKRIKELAHLPLIEL